MAINSTEYINITYLNAIENELQRAVMQSDSSENSRLYEMLAYHMGWMKDGGKETSGKRIRPLIVLLTCAAAGGEWRRALPAASAVELVHNFSLIHDDIEDQSPTRRGRPTVWKKWGIPQAINCGDAMFALAHLEAIRLSQTSTPAIALKAVELLQSTCLRLTEGQFLDLTFEARKDLSIDDYWQMVEGKTAALVAASTELGAMAAFCDESKIGCYRKFGRALGLAFQAQDDFLGIWGNSGRTGKSTQSDLITGKITLPVLFGLAQAGKFARRWMQGSITESEVLEIVKDLEAEGSKEFTLSQVKLHTDHALSYLQEANPSGEAGEALRNLALNLVNRQS